LKKKLTIVLLAIGLHTHSQTARPYSVVIDEIMADPTPPLGLPNAEFIELKNVSAQAYDLTGWRIGDANGFASIGINFILQPDSFVIISNSSGASSLSLFGTTIAVSNFPSLDNDADQLYLQSKEGSFIHAVAYASAWYQNPVKSQGGWTLEMIDTRNPCSGTGNWTASNDLKGGTPGKKNSVDAINKDQQPPALLGAFAPDSAGIVLSFDEPLDSISAIITGNYTVSDGIGEPIAVIAIPAFFNKLHLKLGRLLQKNKTYTVTVNAVTDCAGNPIGSFHTAKLGIATVAESNDIVINEILFNPKPDGADYVELYNRSSRIIDLKDCYIANRSGGIIGSLKQISAGNRLLFPGGYAVVTDHALAVQKQYLAKDPGTFTEINAMPSFPDDKGDVVLLNAQGAVIDELAYDEHWQFKLLNNDEGVALERVDYNKPAQDPANWHSAAGNAGYGTPGYQNSQFNAGTILPGSIVLTPGIFSPDNDGHDDFLTINYRFPDPGYVCNITIFNASGRPVRYLTHNALCGLSSYFRWDGLDDKFLPLPVGVYIVFTEVFNLAGKTNHFKQAVVLARKL
jgi:hypothetical protein